MPNNELLLLRHATAGGAGAGGDFDRTLTETGRAEARSVGLRLAEREVWPDRVLCSEARRCRETWSEIAAALSGAGDAPEVQFDRRLYNAPAETLLEVLAEQSFLTSSLTSSSSPRERGRRTLLIAHNPGISHLAYALGRGDPASEDALRAGFAPATLARFQFGGSVALGTTSGYSLASLEQP